MHCVYAFSTGKNNLQLIEDNCSHKAKVGISCASERLLDTASSTESSRSVKSKDRQLTTHCSHFNVPLPNGGAYILKIYA
jgi:hypothetical protein